MTHTPGETAMSMSSSRQDTTVSVDFTCRTAMLADALEDELRGMVSRGALRLELARQPIIVDGEIARGEPAP